MSTKKIGILFAIVLAITGMIYESALLAFVLAVFWLTASYNRWKVLFSNPYLIKTAIKLTLTLFIIHYHFSSRYNWYWVSALLIFWWIAGAIKVDMTLDFLIRKITDKKALWTRRGIAVLVFLILLCMIPSRHNIIGIGIFLGLYWYLGLRRKKLYKVFALAKSNISKAAGNLAWEILTFLAICFFNHGILDHSPEFLCLAFAWFYCVSVIEPQDFRQSVAIPEKIATEKQEDKTSSAPLEKTEKSVSIPEKMPEPKSSFALASFLSQNIVTILLILGVSFVFTAVVVFLRSHWESYKYLVFGSFLLCTLTCFAVGYNILRKNQWIHKIGFTLVLLASVFFPLNFYFAVKVGLLADHGNRYIVFWLTSLLFAWNAWLLRSALFTLLASILVFWSHFLTLQKFIVPSEKFALFFALNSILFLLPAYFTQKKTLALITLILQSAANLISLIAIVECVFWWNTDIFSWVMLCTSALGLLQILFLPHPFFALFSCASTSISLLLAIAGFSHIAGMATFWQGILPVLASFLMLGLMPRYAPYLPDKGKDLVQAVGFIAVPVVLVVYCILGAYTTHVQESGLVAFPVAAMLGYIAINRLYHSAFCTSLAIAMNGLLIINLYQKTTTISHSTWSVLFLLWGLVLAGLEYLPLWKKKEWIQRPLFYASHIVVLMVLVFVAIWGKEFYQEHFNTLTMILVFALCFYIYCSISLQRKDMMLAGILILLVLCVLHANRLDASLQYICFSMTALGIFFFVSGHFLCSYSKVFSVLPVFALLLVIAFTLVSFFRSLGYDLWIAQSTVFLGMLFFLIRLALYKKRTDIVFSLAYFTAGFFLVFHEKIDFYSWGTLYLFLAILALILAIYFFYSHASIARILGGYASVLILLCLVQLLVHWNFYYATEIKTGILFTFLFFFASIGLWCYSPNLFTMHTLFIFGYVHYYFWLPRNLYAFEYALYFIPVAIALLALSKHLREDSLVKKVAFSTAQLTVFSFLALPFLMPGVTPGALVSTFVIGLAFAYYFLYIVLYRQTFYCYLSSILFLACLLAALFASKKFHGNEMTFILSLGNVFLLMIAYLIKKKNDLSFALPIFRVNLLCNMGLIVSVLVQGKIVNPTLMTLSVCSVSFALLSFFPVEKLWLSRKTMSYTSVTLFAIAYYLMLEKLSLYTNIIEFQYILLSLISLGLALLLRKTEFFHAFLGLTLLAPILALSKNQGSLSLSILMFLSGIFYGIVAHKIQEKMLAFLSVSFGVVGIFAMGAYYSFTIDTFMLVAIVLALLLLYLAAATKSRLAEIWTDAMLKNGYLAHVAFFFLFVGVPHASLYYPISLSLVSAILLFVLYRITRKHLGLAALSFFFSYYATLISWAANVWEFYTVPLGLFLLVLGYIFEKSDKEADYHNDCFFLGIVLILLPTLVQSCSGWFAHLAPLGISPYKHLYHSLFLSIESLAVLIYGVTQKRLIFFFSGTVFLLSDILLLLFAYVNFGTIPQAIWWASLGSILILSAWLLEYRREMLRRILAYMAKQWNDSVMELKTWQ